MRMHPRRHGVYNTSARASSIITNEYFRMKKHNEKLKDEVYSKSDDDFYETYSKYPRSEIKNRYMLQRLREIELKRRGIISNKKDNSSLIIIIFIIIFIIVVITNINSI